MKRVELDPSFPEISQAFAWLLDPSVPQAEKRAVVARSHDLAVRISFHRTEYPQNPHTVFLRELATVAAEHSQRSQRVSRPKGEQSEWTGERPTGTKKVDFLWPSMK